MNTILSKLESLPIFRLSLGSKELFHSNFLEFLWDTDRAMFVRIINRLLPSDKQLPDIDYSKHELSREKENLDVCLYHKEQHKRGNKVTDHIVYDLIIENKVKSIPSKQQLDEYVEKIKKNKWNKDCPCYLLLSLVEDFAEKQTIIDDGIWIIANYHELKTAIEAEKGCWSKAVGASYIEDYCTFIGLMHELQKEILRDFNHSQLFQDVEAYKECRLHDLYIKLRCFQFLMLLKMKLEQSGIASKDISFIKEHKDIRKNKTPHIYLNANIFSGVGQAAAWIYKDTDDQGDVHEIVIQGNQYRHGINSWKHKLDGDKINSQQHIWNELCKDSFDAEFLQNLEKPDKVKKGRKASFNGYGPDYVYRYDIITNKTVDQLLDRMASDVINVYNH